MTAMTRVICAAGEWTLAHTNSSGGAATIAVQSLSADSPLRVRVGASVATTDDFDDPYGVIQPMEWRALTLANGDKVMLAPHRRVGSEDESVVNAMVWG